MVRADANAVADAVADCVDADAVADRVDADTTVH